MKDREDEKNRLRDDKRVEDWRESKGNSDDGRRIFRGRKNKEIGGIKNICR